MAGRCLLSRALLCLSLVLSPTIGLLRAEEAITAPAGAEGASAENPVVRLTPDGPFVPWDALRIGEFSLVDQLGRPVTNESLRGKPWIANFIFTRCIASCPRLLKNTYDLQEQLKDVDFRIVSITVDPAHDTVEVMKNKADIFEVDPDRWLFVTGPEDKVYDLIRNGFKQSAWKDVTAAEGMEFAHSNNLIHVDADGVIVGKYDSHVDADLLTLGQVLKGRIKTPKKHSPVAITTSPPPPAAKAQMPGWIARLPTTNAMLNTLATLLLLGGYSAIRVRNIRLHRKLMILAFMTSVTFLASYLTYHYALRTYTGSSGKPFEGEGWIRPVYFALLISHIALAFVVAIGAPTTLVLGLRGKFDTHRRVARFVYPVWLYVSITGVVIYLMLYHLPG
jgi:protein SCO1